MIESISGAATIFAQLGIIFADLVTGSEPDFFQLRSAMRGDGVWLWGIVMTLAGGLLVAWVYRVAPWVDRNLESTLMVVTYLLIGAIIFVEVIRRFVFSEQFPWSTTVPGYLFLIMTWTGCSYNVRLRTHLSFSEFRSKMGRFPQMVLLSLDAVLWWGICLLVIVTSMGVVANAGNNFMIVTGTNNVMVWWFLITLPIAFVLLSGRVFQNLFEDIKKYRSGDEPMIEQAVLGGQ
ncbi:TRAP transporter small permease subunit [Octadecabacter sp. G9-8]|uniref:TRAP transporter small permease protein n=1 Tax=Octadecabacter dasysiphoniae TaxID=2909341 RepID=A0ABS9CRS2_9RHOB|nr:TRAP transporter small permease subunit [Octadecabacter dasysiphoniae]MCF2869559.1 TRAP transporter small permease subunit [Octadecabacter dasysiphoniae]